MDYRCQMGLLSGAGLESAPSGSLGRAAAAVAPRRQCPQDWPGSQLAVRSDPVVGLGCILMPSGRHQGAQRSSQLLTAPNRGEVGQRQVHLALLSGKPAAFSDASPTIWVWREGASKSGSENSRWSCTRILSDKLLEMYLRSSPCPPSSSRRPVTEAYADILVSQKCFAPS